MATCDHCGRTAGGYATGTGGERLCHPDDPNRPDCYRRVVTYGEPLGALKGIGQLPPGVVGVPEDAAFAELVELGHEIQGGG